jgi:UDP-glucose 4-epimerase
MQQQFSQSRQKILITGGSGYIGQVTTLYLLECGYDVWILDNNTPKVCPDGQFIQCSKTAPDLDDVFQVHHFHAVIHLAALISVGDSVQHPDLYFQNNVLGTRNLLQAMNGTCKNIVFSSSAAVYGSIGTPATESTETVPTSPYGSGKLQSETDIHNSIHINSCILRLFNVAGAIPLTSTEHYLGEEHLPETHLIPLVIQRHLHHKAIQVFGNSYDTSDGTCIREYVHVQDVAMAIQQSLMYLLHSSSRPQHSTFNVSSGVPASVLDVIQALNDTKPKHVAPIQITMGSPRVGDPAQITSNIELIEQELNWSPKHSALQTITSSAWLHQMQIFSTEQ